MSDIQEQAAKQLMRARVRLIVNNPWYGHMCMDVEWEPSAMTWIENEDDRTMGMAIRSPGTVKCLYNPEWVNKQSVEILYGTIEHSINHLIRLHTMRQRHLNPDAWNIATDMAVNGHKSKPHIGFRQSQSDKLILPEKDMIFVPKEWPDTDSAEDYYDRIMEQMPEQPQPQSGDDGGGEGAGQGQEDEDGDGEGEGNSQVNGGGQSKSSQKYEAGKFKGTGVDSHEIWNESDVSHDQARQLIYDMARQATEKNQGHAPGHLAEILESLAKPVVRWREILKQYLGKHVGNNRKTWSRLNRRQGFGIKGISHHAAAEVSVIIDTSGSIGTNELEQFFAEIEAMTSRARVHVLQWDAAFQGFARYRRSDWKTIKIKGRGGTNMVQPVEWLEKNNAIGDICVMLTDGYTPWPTKRDFPMMFVITTDESRTTGPDWGEVVRMRVSE